MPKRICKLRFRRETRIDKEIHRRVEYVYLIDCETEKEVAHMGFWIERKRIYLAMINSRERNKGYGSILIRLLKALSRAKNKPIEVDSLSRVVAFYGKNGFIVKDVGKGIVAMMWNPKKTI